MSSCIAIHTSSSKRIALASTGTNCLKRARDIVLAAADSHPRPQRRELREIAVATKTEMVAGHLRVAACPDCAATRASRSKPIRQCFSRSAMVFGRPYCLHIISVRIESDRALADAARDQRLLPGANHAHGDVRIPPQQILVAIADRQLQRDAGMASRKRASIGGSTSHPIISLAATRTVPRSALAPLEAVRAAPPTRSPWSLHGPRVRAPPGLPSVPAASARTATVRVRFPAHRYDARRSAGSAPAFAPRPTGCRRATTSRKVRNSSQPGSLCSHT